MTTPETQALGCATTVVALENEIESLRARVEQYRKGHERYETARRMSLEQWEDAWTLNITPGTPIDEIIDDLAPYRTAIDKAR